MKDTDILALLIYCNELDGRHAPNEAKVLAWAELLNSSAKGITLDFAKDVARKHYSKLDVMLTPAVLVKAWDDRRRLQTQRIEDLETLERHCGTRDCACTHEDPCYKGWFDRPEVSYVSPCPICRTSLYEVLGKVNPLGQRTAHDSAMIRLRHVEE